MSGLSARKCKPCEGGTPPLSRAQAAALLTELKAWRMSDDAKSLVCDLVMKDFLAAVSLIQAVSVVAEAEDHHPDIHLTSYRKLRLELSTHSIGGLSENDFILAAKIDRLPKSLK